MKEGIYLKFFMQENQHYHHLPLYEWILQQAKKLGLPGGSAFKAIAGYGRDGVMHEDHFFELAGQLPVELVFMLDEAQAGRLLDVVAETGLPVFYIRIPAQYGTLNGASA